MAKQKFEDDGRTVANMDVEGMPGYGRKRAKKQDGIQMTKPEKRAFDRALLFYTLKIVGIVAVGFAAAFLLLWLWLK